MVLLYIVCVDGEPITGEVGRDEAERVGGEVIAETIGEGRRVDADTVTLQVITHHSDAGGDTLIETPEGLRLRHAAELLVCARDVIEQTDGGDLAGALAELRATVAKVEGERYDV